MPLRLHSMPAGQGCPMNGSSALGSKAGALKGLGAKTGSGAGLGLGQCSTTTVGKMAVGAKGVPIGWGQAQGQEPEQVPVWAALGHVAPLSARWLWEPSQPLP